MMDNHSTQLFRETVSRSPLSDEAKDDLLALLQHAAPEDACWEALAAKLSANLDRKSLLHHDWTERLDQATERAQRALDRQWSGEPERTSSIVGDTASTDDDSVVKTEIMAKARREFQVVLKEAFLSTSNRGHELPELNL